MNTDESNYSESTMYTHTLVFCKDNKTTGDFFCFKKKADKRAYGARETLYQKVERCRAPHENKKTGILYTEETLSGRLLCMIKVELEPLL